MQEGLGCALHHSGGEESLRQDIPLSVGGSSLTPSQPSAAGWREGQRGVPPVGATRQDTRTHLVSPDSSGTLSTFLHTF